MAQIRKFSELEKEFIKIIVEKEGFQRRISDILEPHLNKVRLKARNSEISIFYEICNEVPTNEETLQNKNKIQEILPIIFHMTILLKYLEKASLIATFNPKRGNDPYEIGQGNPDKPSGKFYITDSTITEDFYKFSQEELVPSQELITYYKNGFVSEEEKRFNKNQMISIAGIIVALFIGISSIIYQAYDKYTSKPAQELQQKQIEQLSSDIHELKESIKKLVNKSLDSKQKK